MYRAELYRPQRTIYLLERPYFFLSFLSAAAEKHLSFLLLLLLLLLHVTPSAIAARTDGNGEVSSRMEVIQLSERSQREINTALSGSFYLSLSLSPSLSLSLSLFVIDLRGRGGCRCS
jgi:hypothetical protein